MTSTKERPAVASYTLSPTPSAALYLPGTVPHPSGFSQFPSHPENDQGAAAATGIPQRGPYQFQLYDRVVELLPADRIVLVHRHTGFLESSIAFVQPVHYLSRAMSAPNAWRGGGFGHCQDDQRSRHVFDTFILHTLGPVIAYHLHAGNNSTRDAVVPFQFDVAQEQAVALELAVAEFSQDGRYRLAVIGNDAEHAYGRPSESGQPHPLLGKNVLDAARLGYRVFQRLGSKKSSACLPERVPDGLDLLLERV